MIQTFGPIDWWAYYKRPLDGPECLRRMGYPPFPCRDCSREDGCGRAATPGTGAWIARMRRTDRMKLLIGGSPCTHWSIAQTKNRETDYAIMTVLERDVYCGGFAKENT